MTKTKQMIINSDIKKLSEVRTFIDEITNGIQFSEEEIFDIKVALCEAVSNAIEHGSPGGTRNKVEINAQYDQKNLKINVTDEGEFKARVLIDNPDPSVHHRGRGISFMLALMDEVNISESKNGTTVKLTKKAKEK